jgi:uncharacterized membrane protein YvlD (DUF360 family)
MASTMTLLRPLIHFYRVQFDLLWKWSGGTPAVVRRAALTLVVAVFALLVTIWLIPGIAIRDPQSGALTAIVLAVLTTLARPLLIGLLSSFSVYLVGVGMIAVQVLLFWLLSRFSSGLVIDGAPSAVLGAITYSLVDTLVAAALSLANDDSFFGTLVRQLAARHHTVGREDREGVVFIQIDGLSHPVLEAQLRAGRLPTLSRWLASGEMRLTSWEARLPSQTSASQAGVLHGNNDGIPGFRWWDKDRQHLMVSNHPVDARDMMRRVSDGNGLLARGGASIGNLLSGDATRSFLTAATIDDPAKEVARSHVLDWFFVSPYSVVRWIALSLGEVAKEIVQARRERLANVTPRGDRAFPYPLARAATNVLLRHLTAALVVEEMYRATALIYADFVDYDEIAHHSGTSRIEALQALGGIDRIIGLLARAAADAPRRYRFVVLSDHGQSPGAMFRDRYGKGLDELVDELTGESEVHGATAHVEHAGRIGGLLSSAPHIGGFLGGAMHSSLRARPSGDAKEEPPDLVVAASGNLAHISFPTIPGRATRDAIEARHPGLIDALVRHPGVAFVMVRSPSDGAVVIGASGTSVLGDGRVHGDDPLAPFGPRAREDLRRVDAMAECGDLVLISQFDPRSGEVASFEHQIGSHGGLGGHQTEAFVMHPAEWGVEDAIVGAPALHRQMRRWLAAAGVTSASS